MNIARAAGLFTALAFSLSLGVAACSSDAHQTPPPDAGTQDAAPAPDPTDAMFDPARVLDIAIEMAPADWDVLRHQGRDIAEVLGEGCQDGPKESPYTYFPAKVTVDGQVLDNSAVRKKGFFGSASTSKPSLKVSFDKYTPDRELSGLDGLTLNNSQQDPSLLKTCLAFKMFRDAGVPASRCNFARVTVNGTSLGVYAHVEAVGKDLLGRHFSDKSGNLYEGQLSDFRTGWSATYEKKTNEDDPDRSDLDAVTAALAASDAELEATLGKVLDLDEFITFWAMEALVAAWDGYAANLNNHYVYHDPTSGKMAFLPWGPDMSFDKQDPLGLSGRPQSVSAKGAIAHRLNEIPAFRERYAKRMMELLDKVWKEDEILQEIDRMAALIAPYHGLSDAVVKPPTDVIRGFVKERRAVISAEIAPTPVVWPYPLPDSMCLKVTGTVSGTFSTTWDTLAQMNPFVTGMGKIDMAVPADKPQTSVAVGAASGDEQPPTGKVQVTMVGSFPDGKARAFVFYINPEVFADGKDGPLDWQNALGVALDVTNPLQVAVIGLVGGGKIHFDQASKQAGAPVSGSFTGSLLQGLLN